MSKTRERNIADKAGSTIGSNHASSECAEDDKFSDESPKIKQGRERIG